jgi:CubicO group peptidase (beta-lactamase class C family)
VPVDPRTLFQIGSTTKTFTGTVAMRLVEAGNSISTRPSAPICRGLRLRDEGVAARATLRHLFDHTGGWLGDYFDDTGMGDDALAIIVERMVELPQWTPLGQLASYNNAGFYLAGRIIEVVTGKPYEAVVQELSSIRLGWTSCSSSRRTASVGVWRSGTRSRMGGRPSRARGPWRARHTPPVASRRASATN